MYIDMHRLLTSNLHFICCSSSFCFSVCPSVCLSRCLCFFFVIIWWFSSVLLMAGDFISVSFNDDDDDDNAFVCSEIAGMTVCCAWLLIGQKWTQSVCLRMFVFVGINIIYYYFWRPTRQTAKQAHRRIKVEEKKHNGLQRNSWWRRYFEKKPAFPFEVPLRTSETDTPSPHRRGKRGGRQQGQCPPPQCPPKLAWSEWRLFTCRPIL